MKPSLADARLLLIFTPELCAADPLEVLEASLPHVDLVQVRIKPPGRPSRARELFDWTRRVLELSGDVPVTVNDRVDVAQALAGEGCAGVHLGQDDAPPSLARERLGEGAWIGLSTHDVRQIAAAQEEPVDYLGIGPIFATETKGYEQGIGPEVAWVGQAGSSLPLFPIGGIDAERASQLAEVGRAAVCGAILGAEDPGEAARLIRTQLERA